MTLLDTAAKLYRQILETKPKNDPMFLEFQQFMVTHFNHAGTVAMREIDAQPIEYKYKQQNVIGGRHFRAFVHPLNTAKMETMVTPQSTPTVIPVAGGATTKTKMPPVQQSDILAAKSQQRAEPAGKLIDSSKNTGHQKNVVVDDAVGNLEPVVVNLDTIKTMKAKAVGELYTADVLRQWLNDKQIETTGKESRTQLAALVIAHTTHKSE
jgi:hypothetical protein